MIQSSNEKISLSGADHLKSRSLSEFLFPVCAKLRNKNVYSASFFSGFFQRPTAQAPEPIFMQNTSNDVVPRKDVPFRG